jgi:uncharacterized protein YbjT (DUF2867 family)
LILVSGATGNVGAELARVLAGGAEQVRALVGCDADRATLRAGVDAFVGDLNRSETLVGAVDGVSAMRLLSGHEGMNRLLADARRGRVERVVLQSSSAVPSGDMSNAVARYHILSERAVRDSGRAWTFLQPNSFVSNTLQWIPQLRAGDLAHAPFADVPVATIDPHHVAAVSARALTSSDHEGRSYRLSGPDSLLPADRVRMLGEVLGRELRFEGQSDVEAREEMLASMPAEYVDAFFSFFADGELDESEVRDTVERVTGRRPRSFEQWASAHADAFR